MRWRDGACDQVGIDLRAADGSGVDVMRCSAIMWWLSHVACSSLPSSSSCCRVLACVLCACCLQCLAPGGWGWTAGAGSVAVRFGPQGFVGSARVVVGGSPVQPARLLSPGRVPSITGVETLLGAFVLVGGAPGGRGRLCGPCPEGG